MNNSFKMKRRTYRDLKADPFVKTPAFAWLLERKTFYAAFVLVGAAGLGLVAKAGYDSYVTMITPLEKPSEFLALDQKQSQASRWASEFTKDPRGIADWHVVGSSQPSHGWISDYLGASVGQVPATMTSASAASGVGTKVVVQTYGAGQGRAQFDRYASMFSEALVSSDDDGVQNAVFENGFITAAGDSIVAVLANSNEDRDRLFGEYRSDLGVSLPDSGCVTISANVDQAARSYLYGEDKYSGLLEDQVLDTQVKINNLPTFTGLSLSDIANIYAEAPEAPLPESIPALPGDVTRPTIANQPESVEEFKKTVSYKVEDPEGPGCGWEWAAQRSPVYDEALLAAEKKDSIESGQISVDDEAQGYVSSRLTWARGSMLTALSADRWNIFAKKTNEIHSLWDKLNSDRAALWPAWETYVANFDLWKTFDARKAEAKKAYDKAVTECKAADDDLSKWEKEKVQYEKDLEQYEKDKAKWDEENEGESQSPSETKPRNAVKVDKEEDTEPVKPTLRDKPSGCETKPERPEIIDQEKPSKPEQPSIPEDVTIPNSWPKPE